MRKTRGLWRGNRAFGMGWICDFPVRLDERERQRFVKEVEVSSSSSLMRIVGKYGLRIREMTTCVILLCLNETRLPLPHFSIPIKSLERRRTVLFLWGGITP